MKGRTSQPQRQSPPNHILIPHKQSKKDETPRAVLQVYSEIVNTSVGMTMTLTMCSILNSYGPPLTLLGRHRA